MMRGRPSSWLPSTGSLRWGGEPGGVEAGATRVPESTPGSHARPNCRNEGVECVSVLHVARCGIAAVRAVIEFDNYTGASMPIRIFFRGVGIFVPQSKAMPDHVTEVLFPWAEDAPVEAETDEQGEGEVLHADGSPAVQHYAGILVVPEKSTGRKPYH